MIRPMSFSFVFFVFLAITIYGYYNFMGKDTFYRGNYTGQLSGAGVTVPVEVSILKGFVNHTGNSIIVEVKPDVWHGKSDAIEKRFNALSFLCFIVLKDQPEDNIFFRTNNEYAGFIGRSKTPSIPCQEVLFRINAENKAILTMKGGITAALTRIDNPDWLMNWYRNSLLDRALKELELPSWRHLPSLKNL